MIPSERISKGPNVPHIPGKGRGDERPSTEEEGQKTPATTAKESADTVAAIGEAQEEANP
jgi:hypothetical protein